MRTATTRIHAARVEPGRHVLEVCDQPPVRPDTIGDRGAIEGRNDDKHALDDLGGLHDRVPSRDLVSLTDGPGRPLRRGRSKAARSPKSVREQAEVRRGATTRRPRWFRQIVRSVPWPAVRLREGRAGRCDRCPASSPASAHRDGLARSTRPRYRRRLRELPRPGSKSFRPGTDGRLGVAVGRTEGLKMGHRVRAGVRGLALLAAACRAGREAGRVARPSRAAPTW